MKERLLILCFLLIALVMSACSSKNDAVNYSVEDTCYNSTVVSFPDRTRMKYIQYLNEKYYVFTTTFSEDYSYRQNSLYRIENGSIESVIPFDYNVQALAMFDENTAVVVSDSNLMIVDILTNSITNQMSLEGIGQNDTNPIISVVDDGFIVAYRNNLWLCDINCNVINRIVSNDIADIVGYFDNYIVVNSLNPTVYSVNWDNETVNYYGVYYSDLGERAYLYESGKYIFDDVTHDLYEINAEDLSRELRIKGSNTLLYPGIPGTDDAKFIAIDSNRYAIAHEESPKNVELVIVEPDADLNLLNRETIIVGGIGLSDNLYFDYLKYMYNSSQNEYLVVLDDYDSRQIVDESMEVFQAELIQDFNQGNTPDVYFGSFFNYNYFGQNGSVVNLVPLFESDDSISLNDIQPCVRNMITNSDGTCYQIMAGYYINGFVALEDSFDTNCISASELLELPDQTCLYRGETANFLLANSIIYSLQQIGEQNLSLYGSSDIRSDQLLTLLDYAITYGESPNSYSSISAMYVDVLNQDVLMADDAFMFSQISIIRADRNCNGERLSYIGYPSIFGSVHLANPEMLMAISSSTEHLEACWDFIKCALSEEMQIEMMASYNQRYPVVTSVLDNYIDSIRNYDSISADSNYLRAVNNLCLSEDNAITDLDLEVYRLFGESVDTLIVRDFGLRTIIEDELAEYYSSGKPIEEIAESMSLRINLYYQENYF